MRVDQLTYHRVWLVYQLWQSNTIWVEMYLLRFRASLCSSRRLTTSLRVFWRRISGSETSCEAAAALPWVEPDVAGSEPAVVLVGCPKVPVGMVRASGKRGRTSPSAIASRLAHQKPCDPLLLSLHVQYCVAQRQRDRDEIKWRIFALTLGDIERGCMNRRR